jgi:heme-degrading monooxygenase HmoA
MIARMWRGYAYNDDKANEYVSHFEHAVFPELIEIEGYCGAYVMKNARPNGVEVLVITLWKSMDAIHKFAGDNAGTAVVAPVVEEILQSFDKTVSHYEVAFNKLG